MYQINYKNCIKNVGTGNSNFPMVLAIGNPELAQAVFVKISKENIFKKKSS